MTWRTLILTTAILGVAPSAPAQADPAQDRFLATYRELVQIDTTLATGSCTAAADAMAARLKAAGLPAAAVQSYAVAEHPREGGLVAVLPGSDKTSKGVLFVAHIDVVDAARADWSSDPFTLIEKDGYFQARGASDNKANAAALIDLLVRLRAEGVEPRRTIKVALTCGEEVAGAFNGAEYLANKRRDLIDADIAFVPSGGAILDAAGRQVSLTVQAGEKVQQNVRLEAVGTGSHGSRPTGDNAIYHLAQALDRVAALQFPVALNTATRGYFEKVAATAAPADAAAIRRLLADPADAQAQAILSRDPAWNGMLRTTCVATVLESGGMANTVPARAAANLNCRLLPGQTVAAVKTALEAAIASPKVSVVLVPPASATPPAPPITPQVLAPIQAVAAQMWPGVAITPTMLTGATDARHFNAVGIPAYGLTTVFNDPDGNGVHAANERVRVRSVLEGREFVYRWARALAVD